MVDYALWEVIKNGKTAPKTTLVEGVEKVMPLTTTEEKAQRRLELKARSTLLMGILNEHQLKFNFIKDAKSLLQATKKSSEVLDQAFDRLQKLISKLEIHGETISQEDVNQKFLRSLSPEWNTHTIVWRKKHEIDTLSLDDLYNNLKIYEPEVKGTSSSSTNIQNAAFVSSNNTSSTYRTVNTAHGTTTASTQATTVNSTTIDNLSDAVIYRFKVADGYAYNEGKEILEEHWKEVFYEWAPRNQENRNRYNTRSVPVETTTSNALILCDGLGNYDWSDQAEEGPTNFALMAYSFTSSNSELNAIAYKTSLESVEARLLVYKKNESVYEEDIKVLKHEIYLREVSITELRRKLDLAQKQKDEIQLTVENFENSTKNLNKLLDCQIVDKSKTEEFVNDHIVSEPTVKKPVVETTEAKACKAKSNAVRKSNGVPIIED
ncbi:hypothetical protein Tco_0487534 [Tanacetum coccineum]